MQVKKQQLEPDMEQWTDFKLGKEYVKNVSCHPAYSTCMQGTLWKMPAWMNHKLESRLPITSICRWHHHNGRKQRGTKKALDKSEREEWKIWLKINIQKKKTKIMASGPITSWQTDGKTMETVIDFIFLGSKITADGNCSQEIQRCLLLGRKAKTNLDSILKSRDITLTTKSHLVKAMVFPIVTYGCESWTIKKIERWRIDAFELWCWRRLLWVPWTPRGSNQLILKEINSLTLIGKTDAEAETSILWPPDTNWLIVKDPDAGKDWRQEKGTTEDEMVGWHHRLEGHEFEQAPGDGNGQGSLGYCSPWGHTELDTTEWLNWKLISRSQWQYKYSKGQNLDYKWSQEKGARTKDI